MADLIDRQAALEELCRYCVYSDFEHCPDRCAEFRNISKLPTIDPESLRKKGEWISVKDRLPNYDTPVIICTDEKFVYAGTIIGGTWFLDNDSWTENVTHWMPLPEPPNADMRGDSK